MVVIDEMMTAIDDDILQKKARWNRGYRLPGRWKRGQASSSCNGIVMREEEDGDDNMGGASMKAGGGEGASSSSRLDDNTKYTYKPYPHCLNNNEVFDDADTYEVHTPEEWLRLITGKDNDDEEEDYHDMVHNGYCYYYIDGHYTMVPCCVMGYNDTNRKYKVKVLVDGGGGGGVREVNRLSIRFLKEDAHSWARRQEVYRRNKEEYYKRIRFINVINNTTSLSSSLPSDNGHITSFTLIPNDEWLMNRVYNMMMPNRQYHSDDDDNDEVIMRYMDNTIKEGAMIQRGVHDMISLTTGSRTGQDNKNKTGANKEYTSTIPMMMMIDRGIFNTILYTLMTDIRWKDRYILREERSKQQGDDDDDDDDDVDNSRDGGIVHDDDTTHCGGYHHRRRVYINNDDDYGDVRYEEKEVYLIDTTRGNMNRGRRMMKKEEEEGPPIMIRLKKEQLNAIKQQQQQQQQHDDGDGKVREEQHDAGRDGKGVQEEEEAEDTTTAALGDGVGDDDDFTRRLDPHYIDEPANFDEYISSMRVHTTLLIDVLIKEWRGRILSDTLDVVNDDMYTSSSSDNDDDTTITGRGDKNSMEEGQGKNLTQTDGPPNKSSSSLQRIIRRIDLMMKDSLRGLIMRSAEAWMRLMKSFIPDNNTQQKPMLIMNYHLVEGNNDDDENKSNSSRIVMDPTPQQLKDGILHMVEYALNDSLSLLKPVGQDMMNNNNEVLHNNSGDGHDNILHNYNTDDDDDIMMGIRRRTKEITMEALDSSLKMPLQVLTW
ncbi:hypothetical protein FOZ63_022625 [Perkinsus olseni]|uniref:Uncharacterized protein n=1 Tax=Perkinsus olseni TaxID=32597 RepID=A0A7J6RZP0_PEROL|nr:hypothetical protein FOZ63_022625 [Perkinsus olseni]